jgi:hypothetical protein
MYDIPFDRSFLQLSSGIRHVMPSNDPKPELTAKASMAQPVSQPAVYANGLMKYRVNKKCGGSGGVSPAFLDQRWNRVETQFLDLPARSLYSFLNNRLFASFGVKLMKD